MHVFLAISGASGAADAPRVPDALVDFVVGRCLDQLGTDNTIVRRWGK